MVKKVWLEEAVNLSLSGKNAREISEKLNVDYEKVRHAIKNWRRNHNCVRENHGQNTKDVKTDIFENKEPNLIKEKWKNNKIIRFGLMGDTQINSKYAQLTYLHDFYDRCAAEGIKVVYHTGDMDEGEEMRMGHKYECYAQGADDHVEEICRVYPKREGIVTKFITGNHDASLYKRAGMDIGAAVARRRDDMIYLGRDIADIELTPNCILRLQHPWDGTAYAISYKIQKMCDAMDSESKPHILAVGHYHKIEYICYRDIHCFQTGCFQMASPFTLGKGISVYMGGWIVEIEVDEDGCIKRITPSYCSYKKGIKDDYKHWR